MADQMPCLGTTYRWRSRDQLGWTASYLRTFEAVFNSTARYYLFNITAADLHDRNPWIIGLVENGIVLAGAMVVVDGFNEGYIGGVVTAPESLGKGFARRVLMHALHVLRQDGVPVAKLTVRVDKLGRPNPAITLFRSLGFQDAEEIKVKVGNHHTDRHLIEDAEPDSQHIRAMWMKITLV